MTDPVAIEAPAGLDVLAEARWPEPGAPEPEPLPGFVLSAFSPLVAATAGRCLARRYGSPPVPAADGDRTALILASVRGDVAIARAVAHAVDSGTRMSPLLFFQSVANAVLGHIASRWGIAGPVLCVSPVTGATESAMTDALELAADVLADGDATSALVVCAEPACAADEQDWSHAVLVRPQDGWSGPGRPVRTAGHAGPGTAPSPIGQGE